MRIWALLVGTDGQLSVMWKFQSSVPSPQRSRRDDQSGYTTVDPAFVASEQTCVLTGEVRAARRHQPHTEPLITHVFKGVDWHRNLRQKQPGLHPKSTRRQRSSSLVALPGAVLNRINSNLQRVVITGCKSTISAAFLRLLRLPPVVGQSSTILNHWYQIGTPVHNQAPFKNNDIGGKHEENSYDTGNRQPGLCGRL